MYVRMYVYTSYMHMYIHTCMHGCRVGKSTNHMFDKQNHGCNFEVEVSGSGRPANSFRRYLTAIITDDITLRVIEPDRDTLNFIALVSDAASMLLITRRDT